MKINWTNSANNSFNDEVDFILEKWNLAEVKKFIKLVEDFIIQLSNNSFLCKKLSKKDIIQIYQVSEGLNRIDLLFFWNNKKSSQELKKYLNH